MNGILRLLFITSVLSLVLGCAGISSVPVGSKQDTGLGPVYFLPTTRIPLTVSINFAQDRIAITAATPEFVADEDHRYTLKSKYSAFHAETFDIKVNSAGLLTNADLESDGRLDEAAVAAARSAGLIFENALAAGGEKLVLTDSIDVQNLAIRDDSGSANSELVSLNTRINAALRGNLRGAKTNFLKRARSVKRGSNIVTINVKKEFPKSSTSTQHIADCTIGFCYRKPISYIVVAEFFDGTSHATRFSVPNGSPIYAARVNRGAFTKWTNKTILNNGMLESYNYVTDGSEIERAVSLPFEVVGGFIAGITKKGEIFESKAAALQKQVDAETKIADLQKKRSEQLAQENTANSSRPLFRFVAGKEGQDLFGQPLSGGGAGRDSTRPSGQSNTGSSGLQDQK